MNPTEESTGFEIVNVRELDVPRKRVFAVFSDPVHLARWWGPNRFTNEFSEFDLRPGGRWKFVMRGPDGAEYPMEKEFVEVSADRIVLDHLDPRHRFRMTMAFADLSGRTGLTWRMVFEDPEEGARIEGFIRSANEENFDRLEDYLAKMD